MSINDLAVRTAATVIEKFLDANHPCECDMDDYCPGNADEAHFLAGQVLNAAAPHILKDMRKLSLYEIEMRDNPEQMKAMRSKMRKEARAVRAEENRLWAEQARLDRELARAAMEADLNKHFPLIEDHLDDGYQVTCDATACDFSTDIGHYGAIMTQWNGHIAEVLSIAGSPA